MGKPFDSKPTVSRTTTKRQRQLQDQASTYPELYRRGAEAAWEADFEVTTYMLLGARWSADSGRCLHSWDFGGCSFHGGQGHGAPSSARSGTLLPPWPVPRSTQSLRCAPGPGHHRSGPGAQNARSRPVPGFLHPSALREQGGAEEERVARTCEGEERCCVALRPGHRGAVLSPLRGA